jgi:hypothetical protein
VDTGFRRYDNERATRPIVAAATAIIFGLIERQDTLMADRVAGEFPVWLTPEGERVSCVEKIKVLNENLAELRALAQDALEDAVLMGCDEAQVREVLAALMAGLVNPYKR